VDNNAPCPSIKTDTTLMLTLTQLPLHTKPLYRHKYMSKTLAGLYFFFSSRRRGSEVSPSSRLTGTETTAEMVVASVSRMLKERLPRTSGSRTLSSYSCDLLSSIRTEELRTWSLAGLLEIVWSR
jgi:hypothetical protein